MWLDRFRSLESQRKRQLQRTAAGPLHQFLSIPFPATQQDIHDSHFVSIDLETSGLDSQHDHILSMGFVEIHHECVDLSTAQHWVIKSAAALQEENVVIHQLTDDVVAQGMSLADAMQGLLPLLAGKVLLAHHARIELGFLSAACQHLYGGPLLIPSADTMAIAQQQQSRHQVVMADGSLRLAALREHYRLPRYKAHHALIDAIATAEVFLAQIAEKRGSEQRLALKNVLTKI